jgi:CRP-like cAMP-binding protein
MELTAALKQVDVFKDIPDAGLRAIAAVGEPVSVREGDVIAVEGGPADALFVIRSGGCRIYKEKGGNPQEVVELEAGTQFGASALLERAPRSATIVATAPTELVAFRAERLLAVLERDPDTAARFYRALAASLYRRLRRTTDDLGFCRLAVADRRGRTG